MVIDLDDTLENADWLKQSWDLPSYKSIEFFQGIPIDTLPAFRELPVYKHAVKNCLIHDDEWVADWAVRKPTLARLKGVPKGAPR